MPEPLDLIVVGAGPAGLAAAIKAQQRHLKYKVLEKGCLVNSIQHFPSNMTFFTTPDLLEIGGIPLVTAGEKPKRVESLNYYRRVAQMFQLQISLYEEVTGIASNGNGLFQIQSRDRVGRTQTQTCRYVILAIGYYDHPNRLGIPGEDLPKVSHYYTEPHPFYAQDVAIVGGRNSAVEAALDLFRHGARVTLIHRQPVLGQSIKYWVLPDIENRIKAGEIKALMETELVRVESRSIRLKRHDKEWEIPNDFVFALTGYHPDIDFLHRIGVRTDPKTLRPEHDPETLETNVKGMFVAGGMTGGLETNRIFIENGRFHGEKIVSALKFDT